MSEVFIMSKALKPRQGSAITAPEREKFLEVLKTTFNVSAAAEAIGRNRTSLYKLRQSDPEFAAAWDEIVEQCLDAVEEVVFRNALEGRQPVNNIFLLRHRRAHIYGERVKVDVGVVVGDSDRRSESRSLDPDRGTAAATGATGVQSRERTSRTFSRAALAALG